MFFVLFVVFCLKKNEKQKQNMFFQTQPWAARAKDSKSASLCRANWKLLTFVGDTCCRAARAIWSTFMASALLRPAMQFNCLTSIDQPFGTDFHGLNLLNARSACPALIASNASPSSSSSSAPNFFLSLVPRQVVAVVAIVTPWWRDPWAWLKLR